MLNLNPSFENKLRGTSQPHVRELTVVFPEADLKLLTALDPDNRLRKAPPIKVFNLFYRQGLGIGGQRAQSSGS